MSCVFHGVAAASAKADLPAARASLQNWRVSLQVSGMVQPFSSIAVMLKAEPIPAEDTGAVYVLPPLLVSGRKLSGIESTKSRSERSATRLASETTCIASGLPSPPHTKNTSGA